MDTFVASLAARLGPGGVLLGDDVRARSADPLAVVPNEAVAILRPRSTDDIASILRDASAARRSVVVQGGRTGVSGGAYTGPDDIVISLERMNRIEAVDVTNRTVTAEAGVTLQALQEAVEAKGLFYPVDLGARGTATVGGMVSTNAGGNRTLRWGMTRERVLGLEVVLPTGTVVTSMNKLVKNNTGYDLKHLFIGGEGTLGVVTRAVFRLVPLPRSHDVALLAVTSYASVLELLHRAQSLTALSAFEVMFGEFYRIVTTARPANTPLEQGRAFYVLIESMGYDPASDRAVFEDYLARAQEDGLAADIVFAQSETQRRSIWSIREAIDVIMKDIWPAFTYDVSLEVSDIAAYADEVDTTLRKQFAQARSVFNGHIGDNNIHLGVTIGADTLAHEEAVNRIVYAPLARLGGSVSAEHGIGTKKTTYLSISRSDDEIRLMRQIKELVDPHLILNARVLFADRFR